ncbi:MAG: TIGR00730 family Rossman fold protein [Litorimonas sp.]
MTNTDLNWRDAKTNPDFKSVAVFCGSSPGHAPEHLALATHLGEAIAQRGLRLVYGGGGLGLMGAVASAAHRNGANVLGIIPKILCEVEALFPNIEHEIVPDMHTRKIRMYREADAFIILPGGIGTLEEAIEVLSWQRLNLHEKPILFLSNTGFWDNLILEFTRLINEGFAGKDMAADILSASSVASAFATVEERLANPLDRKPLMLRAASVETLA